MVSPMFNQCSKTIRFNEVQTSLVNAYRAVARVLSSNPNYGISDHLGAAEYKLFAAYHIRTHFGAPEQCSCSA